MSVGAQPLPQLGFPTALLCSCCVSLKQDPSHSGLSPLYPLVTDFSGSPPRAVPDPIIPESNSANLLGHYPLPVPQFPLPKIRPAALTPWDISTYTLWILTEPSRTWTLDPDDLGV